MKKCVLAVVVVIEDEKVCLSVNEVMVRRDGERERERDRESRRFLVVVIQD